MKLMKVVLVTKMKAVFKMKIMLMTVIFQSCYTKERMEQNLRKEKYHG